jgi:hypothetical protein
VTEGASALRLIPPSRAAAVAPGGLEHAPGGGVGASFGTSFVSLLSDSGVSLEDIAELCGQAGTRASRKRSTAQLRPVLPHGAVATDRIFDAQTPTWEA